MKLQLLDKPTLDWAKSQLEFQHLEVGFTTLNEVNPDSRRQLRGACLDMWSLTPHLMTTESEFLNLQNLPRLARGDLGLSHTAPWGWAALSLDASCRIGIDAERADRTSFKTLQRISDAEEISACPTSPTHLWVAKEAAFKALSKSHQVTLLSDIQIDHWTRLAEDRWLAKARPQSQPHVSIRGLIFAINDCIFSIFKSHLNFPPGTPIKL